MSSRAPSSPNGGGGGGIGSEVLKGIAVSVLVKAALFAVDAAFNTNLSQLHSDNNCDPDYRNRG